MSQNDFVIDNQTTPNFRSDLNDALGALATLSSGTTEPVSPFGYMLWQDTTTGILKQYNSAGTTPEPLIDAIGASPSPLDEDDFASNSATEPPTQQSTKAYVDAQDRIKAWVNFNGTGTVAIRDSYNVSSITDSGTGDYVVNFTSNLSNANYAAVATTSNETNSRSGEIANVRNQQVGSVGITCINISETFNLADVANISLIVVGA